MSAWLFLALVVLVGVERLAELRLTRRHLVLARARGGREHGQGHFPVMVVLHTAFLVAMPVEVLLAHRPFLPWLGWPALGVAALAMALRWWCIRTLGERWSTRIVVVPGLDRVRTGPYRWWSHPNYVAVVVEGVALPLVHTAWASAAVFTVCNAALLRVRIRAEDAALDAAGPGSPAPAATTAGPTP